MSSLMLQNGRLVTEKGFDRADILIEDGIIKYIEPVNPVRTASRPGGQDPKNLRTSELSETIDATDLLIFPGLIDCHVHFREPGKTESEDMESGSRSALAGGVTTVCDMPNTDPPTCTIEALLEKRKRAEQIRLQPARKRSDGVSGFRFQGADIRVFFGATKKEHLEELESIDRRDICGVKLYFDHSTGDMGADSGVIEEAFRLCAERKIPVVCHAEDAEINAQAKAKNMRTDVASHSICRPPESEMKAVDEAITLAKRHGTQLHIAHLSTKLALDLVAQAKSDGMPVTCEVTPHHLFLSIEDYESLGTLAKMNPPLRTRDHLEALWQGIANRTIDCIATDHAPHTMQSKQTKHPLDAPSGVPGVETMLPLLLSIASGHWPHPSSHSPITRLFDYSMIRTLCFTNPNRIFSLGKPGITIGKPANLILIDPAAEWRIHGKSLQSKCAWTPYEGWDVRGKVVKVLSTQY